MKIGDALLVVHNTKSSFDVDLGSIDGFIIDITEKAIRVEWEVDTKDHEKIYLRTWIPKSLILIITVSKFEHKGEMIDYYGISLPEWAKLDVAEKYDL